MPVSNERMSRRGFIDRIIQVCGAIAGVAMLAPALLYLWPVTRSGPVKAREEVGSAADWAAWSARKASVAGKPVLIIRTDSQFIAMSAVCTHLGCLVEFNPPKRNVICPCHAASFGLDGAVTGGPPPRPLPLYSVAEVQGKVFVSL
jgi:cytochrome b6-f complex iron-sulfur subunit